MKIACWRREEDELEWSILILSMEEASVVYGQPLSYKVKVKIKLKFIRQNKSNKLKKIRNYILNGFQI